MIAYVDSSVLLRLILDQPDGLDEWELVEVGVASTLVRVECLRTLDRLRLRADVADNVLAGLYQAVRRLTDEMEVIRPDDTILARAADPFPTSLGTLDAIHLSTAMAWRDQGGEPLMIATHDRALALAATAVGFGVIGT